MNKIPLKHGGGKWDSSIHRHMLSQGSWDLTANWEWKQQEVALDTMANLPLQELQLRHSECMHKGGVAPVPSATMVCSWSKEGVRITNQKQSSKGSIPVYLYIAT